MAGTAAGIAKANAARLRKRAEREAAARIVAAYQGEQPAQPQVTANETNEQPTSANEPATALPQTVVGVVASLESQPAGNQQLAPYVPSALDLIGKILRGSVRAPVAVRANVALRVVEMAREDAGKAPGEAPELSVLSRLEQALALRRRKLAAVDAEPVSGGDPVAQE